MQVSRSRKIWSARPWIILGWCLAGGSACDAQSGNHGLQPVSHERVELRGGFWGPRLKTHHEVTIPHVLDHLERAGHMENFDIAAGKSKKPIRGHHAFDSDLHKALEGALYSLQHYEDPKLLRRVEGILRRILAAQQDDGYLVSYFIAKEQDQKWQDMRLRHQLYNAGHFFEMAVAHHRLSKSTAVLDAAKRFADHIDSVFGEGKRYEVPGHQEIELALIKLHETTGERRYLDLCRFFLDERGYAHGAERKPLDPAKVKAPEQVEGPLTSETRRARRLARLRWRNGRMQDHKPLVDQRKAVGHAVRAGYVYSAMADVARLTDAPDFEKALDHLWQDVVEHKLYLTGGVGTAQYHDEGYGDPYLLPNETAYNESCSSIAHMLWQHRMNLLKGESKYADMMELVLYNGVLAGVSISGDSFFYQNPLASKGKRRRRPWISLACCPTNYARIFPQLGGFAYAQREQRIYVNMYTAGKASLDLGGGRSVTITQSTNYPFSGKVRLTVGLDRPTEFALCLRIPSWVKGRPVPGDLYRFANPTPGTVSLKCNGKTVGASPRADGYVHLKRAFKSDDVIELDMPMPVRRVYAHENVEHDRGRVALMRGPIVYCLEGVGGATGVREMVLPKGAKVTAARRDGLLGGVVVLRGKGLSADKSPVDFTAVPYYAWQNRGPGAMTVWMVESR